MTDSQLERVFGSDDPDPGCDRSGELMDEYCELVHRGDRVSDRFEAFLTHIANCTACREDTEGLLAALREEERARTR
jgi:hypothetical protein